MIEILKKIPFFEGLSDEDLADIGKNVKMDYFPADYNIFKEGDPGDRMYIIKRGSVQVIRGNAIIAVLKDNAFFGEMALVSNDTRNATVHTVSEVETLTLAKEDFQALISTRPSIAEIVSFEVVKRSNQLY